MEAGRLSPSVLHQLQLLHIHTGFARQFLCGNGAEAEAEAEAAAAAMAMAAANAAAAAAAQAQTQAASVTSAATSSATAAAGAGFPVFPAMHARLFSESAQFGSFSPPVVTLSQAEAMEQHLTHLSLSGGNHGELVTRPCRTAVVWDDTGLHQTSEDVDDSESQAQELAWMMEQQASLKSGSSPPMYIF
eukprot:m.10572 g.10572  ORF g.10572 m.10572 type:complete len:189 (+) comp5249_c0_seq1:344-910(+)